MNKGQKKILRTMLLNAPSGATTAMICLCLHGASATPAQHKNLYSKLRRLEKEGYIKREGPGYWSLNYHKYMTSRRRYYIHSVLKKFYTVEARKKTIRIPAEELREIHPMARPYLERLRRAGYNIQYEIS